MISEKAFINTFTSFWQELLPISEKFVRNINLQLERFSAPIETTSRPDRRSLISEIAFGVFSDANLNGYIINQRFPSKKNLKDIAKITRLQISRLDRKDIMEIPEASRNELDESLELAYLIQAFFSTIEKDINIIVHPHFDGCGFIDGCFGDVLAGETLYEIKSGDRPFRSVDLRQIIIYCALNYAGKSYEIKRIGMFNPRLGVFFKLSVDDFALNQGGRSAIEIFGDIIQFISGGEISK